MEAVDIEGINVWFLSLLARWFIVADHLESAQARPDSRVRFSGMNVDWYKVTGVVSVDVGFPG